MKEFLKKNKVLLILPLALLPFVVLIFYILGGGENAGKQTSRKVNPGKKTGANYELPEADQSIEIYDKMEAHRQGKGQATTTRDYPIIRDDSPDQEEVELTNHNDQVKSSGKSGTGEINANVSNNLLDHIKSKEMQVQKEMDGTGQDNREKKRVTVTKPIDKPMFLQPEILQKTGIEELDQVFDKNITLSRQNDSLRFELKKADQKLKEVEAKKTTGFNLEKTRSQSFSGETSVSSLIRAEVYETTTVLDGNRVKLRLLEDCRVNGKIISKNTFLYGICQIRNERLHIQVKQLPTEGSFLPVNLEIHDLDGLSGLYIPDNATRKIAKEVGSSTNTSSLFGVTTDPLTYAGVRAADRTAQSLFKMVRLKKVTIKKNTLVYLINQKEMP